MALVAVAAGSSGWLHRGTSEADPAIVLGLENQLRIASEEVKMLKRENDSLRSLAQGGGEVAVPPEMLAQVEADYGLVFLSSPVLHRIAREELGYRVEAAIESQLGPQGVDDRQEAYERIGWITTGDRLLDSLVAVRTVGAKGWFDSNSGEAWLTDDFALENIPDQAVMLRLLVRILLHQHFPPPSAYPGDDFNRAREALHDGAAAGAVSRFYAANAREIGFLPSKDNSAASRLLMTLSPFIKGLLTFSAIEGKNLADTKYIKGADSLLAGLRSPPESTYRAAFPNAEKSEASFSFAEVTDEIYLTESAGYLGLRLWLAELGDHGIAEETARAWRGDAYILYAEGENSTGLIWKIQFANQQAADQFAQAASARFAVLAGKQTPVPLGEFVESASGRFLKVEKPALNQVTFINTSTRQISN